MLWVFQQDKKSFLFLLEQILMSFSLAGFCLIFHAVHAYARTDGDKKFVLLISQGIDLLKSQRTDKVDITLRPEELEGLDDVALAAKYVMGTHEFF
jgi:hypothetical protein